MGPTSAGVLERGCIAPACGCVRLHCGCVRLEWGWIRNTPCKCPHYPSMVSADDLILLLIVYSRVSADDLILLLIVYSMVSADDLILLLIVYTWVSADDLCNIHQYIHAMTIFLGRL